jgi:YD repeat-containing protein
MKKFITLLVLIVVSFAAMGQENHDSRHGWADHATFFLQPVLKGDISKIIVTHEESPLYIVAIYEFNTQGDVVSMKNYTYSGVLVTSIEYSYDYDKGEVCERYYDGGELTDEFTVDIAGTGFEFKDNSEYTYDAQGRVVEHLQKFNKTTRRTIYEYDAKGNKSKITIEETDKPTQLQEFIYDDCGNVVELNLQPGNHYEESHTKYDIIYR